MSYIHSPTQSPVSVSTEAFMALHPATHIKDDTSSCVKKRAWERSSHLAHHYVKWLWILDCRVQETDKRVGCRLPSSNFGKVCVCVWGGVSDAFRQFDKHLIWSTPIPIECDTYPQLHSECVWNSSHSIRVWSGQPFPTLFWVLSNDCGRKCSCEFTQASKKKAFNGL